MKISHHLFTRFCALCFFSSSMLSWLYPTAALAEVQPRELLAPGDIALEDFGASVCGSQQNVVVGAPRARNGSGIVFVYRFNQDRWERSLELGSLQGKNQDFGASFGAGCVLSAQFLVVVAPQDKKIVVFRNNQNFDLAYIVDTRETLKTKLNLTGNLLEIGNLRYVLNEDQASELEESDFPNQDASPCFIPKPNELGLEGEFRSSCFETSNWLFLTLKTQITNQNVQRVYAVPRPQTEGFLSENEVEEELAKSCGALAQQTLECVESTLHALWEQHRILYSVYDPALKKRIAAQGVVAVPSQSATEGSPSSNVPSQRLFDKFLEQNKLERLISLACSNLIKTRFESVARQLEDGSSSSTAAASQDSKHEQQRIQQLKTQLKDLLDRNPELPVSPVLESSMMSCGALDAISASEVQNSKPQKFKVVAGVLDDNTTGQSPPVAIAPEEASFYQRLKNYLGLESEKRQAGISGSLRMKEIQTKVFENTRKLLDPATSQAEQDRLSRESAQLQEELVSIAQGLHDKYGK